MTQTMEVFISWSGPRSEPVAKALRDWLPKIINALKPWISSADMDKGARWATEIATKLESARAGIICLTPSNLHSDWILFEAGALSKTVKNTLVCPLLIDLVPSEVEGPLSQFQLTRATKDDVLKLVKTLNQGLDGNALGVAHIEEVFEAFWPRLAAELERLPADQITARPQRSERDLMEEVLQVVRGIARKSTVVNEPTVQERIVRKTLRLLNNLIGGVNRVSANEIEGTLVMLVHLSDGKGFELHIPMNTPDEQIYRTIAEQVPSALTNPRRRQFRDIDEASAKKEPR
jgi:hypothetical protein